jgi:hypothetical protein
MYFSQKLFSHYFKSCFPPKINIYILKILLKYVVNLINNLFYVKSIIYIPTHYKISLVGEFLLATVRLLQNKQQNFCIRIMMKFNWTFMGEFNPTQSISSNSRITHGTQMYIRVFIYILHSVFEELNVYPGLS